MLLTVERACRVRAPTCCSWFYQHAWLGTSPSSERTIVSVLRVDTQISAKSAKRMIILILVFINTVIIPPPCRLLIIVIIIINKQANCMAEKVFLSCSCTNQLCIAP